MSPTHSLASFARRHRVDRKAVVRAVENGRLERSVRKVGGRIVVVDLDLADREWEANRDEAKFRGAGARKSRASLPETAPGRAIRGARRVKTAPPGEIVDPGASEATGGERPTIADGRRGLIQAQTLRAELIAGKMAGKLVDADGVTRSTFEAFRTVRDNLLNLSGRLAHELAAMTDPVAIQARLDDELRLALGGAADTLEQAARVNEAARD